MKDNKAPVGPESEREELGLSAAMVGLGQVTAASNGSVESTLVMDSLGYESVPLWPDVPGVFFPEPYMVDHSWADGAPEPPETDDEAEQSAGVAISGEWISELSEKELEDLEREPTYIDLGAEDDEKADGGETDDPQGPELRLIDPEAEVEEIEESDIEEIEALDAHQKRSKVGAPPVPKDAREVPESEEVSATGAKVLPLDRSGPRTASGTLPEARSDQPDGWDLLTKDRTRTEGKSWVETVFDDLYVQSMPHDLHKLTRTEVTFTVESLKLRDGASILDLGCGFGRHAILMAEHGFEVTGIDLSETLLKRAQRDANRKKANVTFLLGDMRQLDLRAAFDATIVLGSTFGYFDDRTNLEVLKRIRNALRPGGRLMVEFLNRDRVVNELPRVTWWRQDNRLYLDESEFDFERSRLCSKRTVIFDDGSPFREQYYDMRLYSLHEVHALMAMAGYQVAQITGSVHHRDLFFPMNSRQLLVLASKPAEKG